LSQAKRVTFDAKGHHALIFADDRSWWIQNHGGRACSGQPVLMC
jgi:hypothetical protein